MFAIVSKHATSGMKIDIAIYKSAIEKKYECDVLLPDDFSTQKKYKVKILLEHITPDMLKNKIRSNLVDAECRSIIGLGYRIGEKYRYYIMQDATML